MLSSRIIFFACASLVFGLRACSESHSAWDQAARKCRGINTFGEQVSYVNDLLLIPQKCISGLLLHSFSKDPQHIEAYQPSHRGNKNLKSFLAFLPSVPHSLTCLLGALGITFQLNFLFPNLCLRPCSFRKPKTSSIWTHLFPSMSLSWSCLAFTCILAVRKNPFRRNSFLSLNSHENSIFYEN